jgi:hypothetical protein
VAGAAAYMRQRDEVGQGTAFFKPTVNRRYSASGERYRLLTSNQK